MAHKEVISEYKALAMRQSVNDCVVKPYNVDKHMKRERERENVKREKQKERLKYTYTYYKSPGEILLMSLFLSLEELDWC